MREFRFLDERRKSTHLSDAEEQRYLELRAQLQMPTEPEPVYAPPQGYYAEDGQWYAYPEGYAPQYAPAYDPNAYAYPQGYDYPPAYAYPEYAQGYAYDPNAQGYAYDPNQAYAQEPGAYPAEPSAYAYPPNAYGYPGYPPAYAPPAPDPNVAPNWAEPVPAGAPHEELPADPFAGAERLPELTEAAPEPVAPEQLAIDPEEWEPEATFEAIDAEPMLEAADSPTPALAAEPLAEAAPEALFAEEEAPADASVEAQVLDADVLEVEAIDLESPAPEETASAAPTKPAEVHRFPPVQRPGRRGLEPALEVVELLEENTPPARPQARGLPPMPGSSQTPAALEPEAIDVTDVAGAPAEATEPALEAEAIDISDVEAAPAEATQPASEPEAIDVSDLEAAPDEATQSASEPEAIDVSEVEAVSAEATQSAFAPEAIDVSEVVAAPAEATQPAFAPEAIDVSEVEAAPAEATQPVFEAEAIDVADVEAAPAETTQPAFAPEAIDVSEVEAAPAEATQPAFEAEAIDVADLEAVPEATQPAFESEAINVSDFETAAVDATQPAFEPEAINVSDFEAAAVDATQPAFKPEAINVSDFETAAVDATQPAFEPEGINVSDFETAAVGATQPAFEPEAINVAEVETAAADATQPAFDPDAIDVTSVEAAPIEATQPAFEAGPADTSFGTPPMAAFEAEPSIDFATLEPTPAAGSVPAFEPQPTLDVTELEVAPGPDGLPAEDAEPVFDIPSDAIVADDTGPHAIDVSFDASEADAALPLESPADAISAHAQATDTGIALPETTETFEFAPTQLDTSQFTELSATDAPTEPFQTAGLAELAADPLAFSTPAQRAAAAVPQAPRWEIGWSDDTQDLGAPAPDPAWGAPPEPAAPSLDPAWEDPPPAAPAPEALLEAAEVELEPELVEEAVIEPEPFEEEPSPDVVITQPMRAQVASLQALPAPAPTAPVPIVHASELTLRPAQTLFSANAGEVAFIEGEHRVIIHTVEGQVKRGLLRDVDLLDTVIPLEQQTGFAPERIPANRVKAIFFMSLPGSRAPGAQGQKIRVTFRDGRQVAGFSDDYQRPAPGFFIVPADNRTNTARIFIFRSSVQSVAEG